MFINKYLLPVAAMLFTLSISSAKAEPIGFKDWEQLLNLVTDVKRGAAAQAVASDTDASPAIEVKANQAGAGLFGVADTGLMSANRDNTHAEASAKNGSFGRQQVYVGDDKNKAGDNGAYSAYAAITWKGKVVKDGANAQFDPSRVNEIQQIVGDKLKVVAHSDASFRLSLAYKIVDLNNMDDSWWNESLLFDDLTQNYGFSKLFDGTIQLGDPTKDVLSGDFMGLSSLFDVAVDPVAHTGTVSYLDTTGGPVSFVVPMPYFSSSQMLLLAADQQAYVNASYGGFAMVQTVPEPPVMLLMCIGAMAGMGARKAVTRRRQQHGLQV